MVLGSSQLIRFSVILVKPPTILIIICHGMVSYGIGHRVTLARLGIVPVVGTYYGIWVKFC
jgi:hypothetical protein